MEELVLSGFEIAKLSDFELDKNVSQQEYIDKTQAP